MPSNTRGKNMVEMVIERSNQSLNTPLSLIPQDETKKTIINEIDPPCNIHDFGGLWAHKSSYDNYSQILTPKVEYASTSNLTQTDLQKQLDLLHKEFDSQEKEDSEDFVLSLLCDETLPSSVMNVTLVSISTELEEICQDENDDNNDNINNVNNESKDETKIVTERNRDKATNETEDYLDEAENECEKIMDEAKNGTEKNIDKAKDQSEENMDDTNNGSVENMDEEEATDNRNNLNEETIQELERNDVDLETNENTGNTCEAPKGKTKSGKPRLRRKYEESLKTRNEKKKRLKLERMSVKPGCKSTCVKKCSSSFTESERQDINKLFWELGYEAQGIYLKSLVIDKEVNRRIRESTQMRKHTYSYFLEIENEKKEVCKIFFLTTLGYDKKNDRRVLDILKKPLNAQADGRSKKEHPKKVNREMLKEHIESFRPAIAHYRRIHAPNRRYLPSDISVSTMHNDFIMKNPKVKVSYDLYRKFLKKDMKISFAQLGNEECELCESHKFHLITCKDTEQCVECSSYRNHCKKYQMARTHYQQDAEQSQNGEDSSIVYFSADLQKVVLLPRLDMFKVAIFCPRIIAFNESFVPLGSNSKEKPCAVLWHEGISGRKQEDIISAYRAFFESKRDCTQITICTDNCTGQNKNWAFFSFLVQIVNSSEIAAIKVIIKYLEPGHTFMSADSFHHQVENQLQKAKKVYDFADFIDCVQLANSEKVNVRPMDVSDFYKYEDHSSQYKLKKRDERTYIKDIVCVEVHRKYMSIFVKTSHDGSIKEINFLKTKLVKQGLIPCAVQNTKPRGITQERKSGILKQLSDIIPQNRLPFWENLPVNNNSIDLVEQREFED